MGLNIPESIFHTCLRHGMSADRVQQRAKVGGAFEGLADHQRRDEGRENVPRGIGGLGIVERRFDGRDLSPSADTVGHHVD